MGYRDDGFFNINWSQDARNASSTNGGKTNPPFIFPDKSIRFLDAQAELQKKFNAGRDTLSRGDYKIHRGYIRNLEQPQFGNVPISRCNFQFNPQEIRQSVAMREDIYLPLLQTPDQLAQPVGAAVNFTFDLMFDRSHELSKGGKAGNITADQAERGRNPESGADIYDIDPEKDPYDIGVLADLRILYSVIGQGFSKEMLEFQKKSFLKNAEFINDKKNEDTTNNPSSTDGADTSTGSSTASTTDSSSLGQIDDVALSDILEANYGNWGLLMPNPIRVMFSSLFMLDGFITGTNVDFLKFSTKMVPLMCRVTMSMSAMYIGFARQDTFLTRTFKSAALVIQQKQAADEAEKAEILKALGNTGGQFAFGSAWDINDNYKQWDNVIHNRSNALPVWALVVNDEAARNPQNGLNERAFYLGFPKVTPIEGGYDRKETDGTVTRVGNDKDDILKLYENGSSFTIGYDWSVTLYGGINSSSALTLQQATDKIKNKTYASDSNLRKVGSYSGSESASSKDEWGSGTSGDGVKSTRVRRRSIKGNGSENLANKAKSNFVIHNYSSFSSVENWVKNAYYIGELNITLRVSYGNAGEISISQSSVFAISGVANINQKLAINWSTETATIINGVSDQAPTIPTNTR